MSATGETVANLTQPKRGGWNFFLLPYLIVLLIRPHEIYPPLVELKLFQGFLVLSALYWLLRSNKEADAPQIWLVPALLFSMVLSMLALGWFTGMLNVSARFGSVLLLFLFVAHGFESPKQLLRAFRVVCVCAVIVAIHGIQVAHQGVGWSGYDLSEQGRIMYLGFHSDPNDLGLFFLMCLPLMVLLAKQSNWFIGKLFWLSGAGLTVYGVYLTHSRGALLSIAAVGALMIRRKFGLFLAGMSGVIGILGITVISSRQIEVGESSAFGRVSSWYEGMQMFIANPVFGVGPGLYTEYNYLTAHNSLVLVLAELGFIGFVVWVAMMGYSYFMMRRMASTSDEEAVPSGSPEMLRAWRTDKEIASALMYSLVGFFVAAFFLSRSFYPFLYVVLGFVVAHYRQARPHWPAIPEYRLGQDLMKWVFGSGVLVVFLWATVKVLHMLR